jgi:hypothetical protein
VILEVAGHRAKELKAKDETTGNTSSRNLLALIALAYKLATTERAESFAKRVDIGGTDDEHRVSWQQITHRVSHLGYGHGV